MPIPLKILNRLRLGRPVAARCEALFPDCRAWVHVRPVVDENKGVLVPSGGDDRVRSTGGDPVVAFLIQFLQIHATFLDQPGKFQPRTGDASTIEHFTLAVDDEQLALCLSRLLPDYNALCIPDDAGYPAPYAFGPISANALLSHAATVDTRPSLPLFHAALSLGQNVFTVEGLTRALVEMVRHGNIPLVQALIDWGVDITADTGFGPLLRVAAEARYLEMVRFLLDRGADVNQEGYYGTLLCFATETNDSELVYLLLKRGADVSVKDYYGRTPLGYAAKHGVLEIVQAIVAKGADVNALSQFGVMLFTPLAIAINNGHRGVATWLWERGGMERRQPVPELSEMRRHLYG